MATRYLIEVRGRLPAFAAAQFPGMVVDDDGQRTSLRGELHDAAALYGTIAHLEALGLTLLTITEEEER